MNADLKEVSNGSKQTSYQLMLSKTNFMIIGTHHMTSAKMQHDLNIILDDTCLDKVNRSFNRRKPHLEMSH